jgi:hypothetical protein
MERRMGGAAIAAGLLMMFQAVLGAVAGLALLASSRRLQRFTFASGMMHHRAGIGMLLVVLAVAAIVVAGFVISGAATARIFAYAIEAVAVVGAMMRLGRHPGIAIVGVGVAILIIVLLATETDEGAANTRPSGGTAPGVGGAP